MNVELLRKIAAVIQEKPQKFEMGNYSGYGPCGTTHCIGGWAEVLTGGDPERCSSRGGRIALGLDSDESYRLFYCDQWPAQFQVGEDGWGATPKQAARRIEHFIATGGRE